MPAIDSFSSYATGTLGPATEGTSVVPSDTNDLSNVSRAIYVGSAGHVRVTLKGGADVTFTNAGSGAVLPIRASRIWQTGSTAADMVALW